jgi:thymidylate synthase
MGGIQLLKKYVAGETGLKDGPMFAYSAGAHIYGYQEEIARLRTLKPKK